MTIKAKLAVAVMIFFLVSIALMGIGFYVIKDTADGLTFINYAGQTRYKTYRLAWLLEELSEGRQEAEPVVRKEMVELERLLISLRDGNEEYNIKGAGDAEISSRLNKHIKDWHEVSDLIEKELSISANKGWAERYHAALEDYVRELDATVALSESKGKAKGKASISEIYFLSVLALVIFFAFLFYVYAKLDSTVDQLTKANCKLETTNRLRKNIVTIVAHELKSPLSSIKGFVYTLLREDANFDEAAKRKYLSTINSEADRLSRLIHEMLDMTRIDMGTLELSVKPASISKIIKDVAERVNMPNMELSLNEKIPDMLMDKNRIEEVILNLIDNAVKYSLKNGKIRVGVCVEKDFIKVTVDDEGSGIQESEREKVFDAFYRGPSISSSDSTGLGLGLYICKGIIEAHKDKIWIEKKEGKGARVAFILPKDRGTNGRQSRNIDS